MSFDTASPETRSAVASEAARAHPAGMAFDGLDRAMAAFIRDLIHRGKITDHPPGYPRPMEPA